MKFLFVIFFLLNLLMSTYGWGANLKELDNLSPYKDVAVLQKKFLPKTERFELFLGLSNLMNDAFFITAGGVSKLAYYFSEQYAIEGTFGIFDGLDRQVVKDLKEVGVSTTGYVTSRQYYGLDMKWSPMYGKMSYLNKRIIPYDIYFTGGLGMTKTNKNQNELTLRIGTGQLFALSKRWAVKWDFGYSFYRGRYKQTNKDPNGLIIGTTDLTQNVSNIFISIGVSMFFPEATYR